MRWVLLCAILPGCCWLAKRDCFPACPEIAPTKIVTVEKACQLPPPLILPAVKQAPCDDTHVCFDIYNAGLLAKREAAMKDWIKAARARCGKVADSATLNPE